MAFLGQKNPSDLTITGTQHLHVWISREQLLIWSRAFSLILQPAGHTCTSHVCMCFLRSLKLKVSSQVLHLKLSRFKWFCSKRDRSTQVKGLLRQLGQDSSLILFRHGSQMKTSHSEHFFTWSRKHKQTWHTKSICATPCVSWKFSESM